MMRFAALALAVASPSMAFAETTVTARGGYFFDDTAKELSQKFLADGIEPQASLVGLGASYTPDAGAPWTVSVTGLWGRGNEHYRDTHLIRQDDEVLVQRRVGRFFSLMAGYRYEFTGVRTDAGRRAISLESGGSAELLNARENQVRHSLRTGVILDFPIVSQKSDIDTAPEDNPHHAIASLSAVVARGQNSLTYVVDADPGPALHEQFLAQRRDDIWRSGPELTVGYKYYFGRRAVFDVRYRAAFLADKLSRAAEINVIHGLTIAVGYRFGAEP